MLEAFLATASVALPALRSDVRHKQELLQARRLHQAEAIHTRELLNEKMTHRAEIYSTESTLAVRRHNVSMQVARAMSRREALRDAWQQRSWFLQTMILIVSLVFSLVFVALTQGRVIDISQVQYTVAVEKISLDDLMALDFSSLVNTSSSASFPLSASSFFSPSFKPMSQICGVYLWMSSTGVSIASLVICLWLCLLVQRRVGRYRVLPSLADAGSASTSTTASTNPFQQRQHHHHHRRNDLENNNEKRNENNIHIDENENDLHQSTPNLVPPQRNRNDRGVHGAVSEENFSKNFHQVTGGAVDGQDDDDDVNENENDEEEEFDDEENEDEAEEEEESTNDDEDGDGEHLHIVVDEQLIDGEIQSVIDFMMTKADKDNDNNGLILPAVGHTVNSNKKRSATPSVLSQRQSGSPLRKTHRSGSMLDVANSPNSSSSPNNINKSNQFLQPSTYSSPKGEMTMMQRNPSFADSQFLLSPTRRVSMTQLAEMRRENARATKELKQDDETENAIDEERSPDFVRQQQQQPGSSSSPKNRNGKYSRKNSNNHHQKGRRLMSEKMIQQLNTKREPTALMNDEVTGRGDGGAELRRNEEDDENYSEDDDDDDDEYVADDQQFPGSSSSSTPNEQVNARGGDGDESEHRDSSSEPHNSTESEENNVGDLQQSGKNINIKTTSGRVPSPPNTATTISNKKRKSKTSNTARNSSSVMSNNNNSSNTNKNEFYYNCGKTHRSFNSYYNCHCEPLRRMAALLLGLGTFCAVLSGTSLHLMLMQDAFHHTSSALFPLGLLVFVTIGTYFWAKLVTDTDRLLPDSMNHGEGDFMGLNEEAREQQKQQKEGGY